MNPPQTSLNARVVAQKAIDMYLLSLQPNGEMGGIGWWQTANGYTAIAMHDHCSRKNKNDNNEQHDNYAVLDAALRACERQRPGLVNEFNDDTLWWGLCCVHMYALRKDEWYLDVATNIWQHMGKTNSVCQKGQATFRNVDMQGAVFWTTKAGEEQVNSITTGLYAELGVRLALVDHRTSNEMTRTISSDTSVSVVDSNRPSRQEYMVAAQSSFDWIIHCRYRAKDAVVLDNIMLKRQEARDWTFTYTTSVAIGVCALLFQATRNPEMMSLACSMSHHAMHRPAWVDDNGVLTERGAYGKGKHEAWQNNDAVGFKAILVRHLTVLCDIIERDPVAAGPEAASIAESIRRFITINFRSQEERNTNGNAQYGPWWNGPFEMSTCHSQMAVLDLMSAAVWVDSR